MSEIAARIGGAQGPRGYDGGLSASAESVVFNNDGTVTQTIDGQAVVWSFPGATVVRTYGPPLNKTITTTFTGTGWTEAES